MERMKRKIGKRKVEIHKMEGLYPYVRLEDFMFVVKQLEEENKKLKSDLEQFSEAYKRYRDFEKEELAESCYDLEKENKKLKEELKDKQKVIQYYRKEKKLMGTQIKKLKEELRKYKKQYHHSMGFSDFGGYDE